MIKMVSEEIAKSLLKRLEQISEEENYKDINELIKNLLRLYDKFKSDKKSKGQISKSKKSNAIQDLKNRFEHEIEKYSNNIVGLSDNWDSQGSKGYNIDTWERTIYLLKNILFNLWDNMIDIPIPTVLPSPDGSFDINWETGIFELLLNIPSDIQEPVSLYGEKIGHKEYEIEVRSKFELVESVVIEWLKMIQ